MTGAADLLDARPPVPMMRAMSGPPPVDYAPPNAASPTRAGAALAQVACVIAAGATAVPLISFVEMLRVPIGTEIRPMAQASSIIVGGVVGIVLVPPLAIVAAAVARFRREPRTRWPIYAGVAALVAAALPTAVFMLILSARQLTLAP